MAPVSDHLTFVYVFYSVVSVGLTVWLARMLFTNGAVFLRDVFKDNPELARRRESAARRRLLSVQSRVRLLASAG